MPKYYDFMICGYYLYFTSHCIVEAMLVHASDKRLAESSSDKLFVKVYPFCSSSGIQDTPFLSSSPSNIFPKIFASFRRKAYLCSTKVESLK